MGRTFGDAGGRRGSGTKLPRSLPRALSWRRRELRSEIGGEVGGYDGLVVELAHGTCLRCDEVGAELFQWVVGAGEGMRRN